MKKRIEQLLNGKFIYEQPELLFSQEEISVTLKAGETTKDELYFGTDDNRRISGFVTSSDWCLDLTAFQVRQYVCLMAWMQKE